MLDGHGGENHPIEPPAGRALDYGFRWFEYHAKQRITTFNFYLIIYSGLAAAFAFLLKERIAAGSILVSLLMLLMSILFWQLDIRNRQLIEIGEEIVIASWTAAGLDDLPDPVARARIRQAEGLRFKELFGIVFLVGGAFGLGTFIYAVTY